MLARVLAASPSRPSERTRDKLRRRKHGTTDRLALSHQNRQGEKSPKVILLRPSVQLPAGTHGWRGYKDSRGVCKAKQGRFRSGSLRFLGQLSRFRGRMRPCHSGGARRGLVGCRDHHGGPVECRDQGRAENGNQDGRENQHRRQRERLWFARVLLHVAHST